MADRKDVVQGTLDLLVPENHRRPADARMGRHAASAVPDRGRLQVTPGSLFPALRRLEESGWASGYWDFSENNRKARYCAITKAGQKQLTRERQNWKSITTAVEKVLEGA